MAIEYLKKGLDEKQRIEDNDKVKKIVEETLSKIETEGDKHIRELSQKFDNYSPDSFRLSEAQINQLMSEVSDDDKEDIKFAQKQVRSFAEAQLKTLSELEVGNASRCYSWSQKYTSASSWMLCACRKIPNGSFCSYVSCYCLCCWGSKNCCHYPAF